MGELGVWGTMGAWISGVCMVLEVLAPSQGSATKTGSSGLGSWGSWRLGIVSGSLGFNFTVGV